MNFEWDVAEHAVLRLGATNSEPKGVHTSGLNGTSWEHLYSSSELDHTLKPKIQEQGRLGHYRFILWNNGTTNPNASGNIDGWGALFNFDQEITDVLTLFGRIGWGDGDVAPSDFSVSCGMQIDNLFGIKNSSMGLAYQYADFSSGGNQTVGEWYYRTKWQED